MEEIFHKLIDAQQNTDIEEHIANIAEMQYNIETGICPRCRGKLVLRKGRYGDFVGCENYPDCKFTKKIDQ